MGRSKSKVSEELIDVKEKDATPKEHVPSISYFTLYRYASRWDKMLIAIAIVASVIVGAIIPYAITTVANTFHNMVMYAKAKQIGIDEKEEFLGQMHRFGILYSCIGVVIFLGAYLGSALMNIAAINQVFKIREAYFKAALNQDFAYFDVRQTGDFASKMADDIIKLEEGIGDKMSALFFNLTTAVSCVAMAVYKGWKLALLCLTTAPVTFILVGLSAKLVSRLSKKEAMASGRASAVAQEVLASIRTVYAFNGQQKELLRYKEPLAQARKIKILREFFVGVNMGFLFFCIFGSYALSFYLGIYLVINDPKNYNADVMFSVFIGVMTGMGNLGMMGSLMDAFSGAKGAGAQIFNLISNVPTINPMLERGFIPTDPKGNIELINVVFKYPARPTVTVLNGVSLKIKRGTSVAFVGQSGCGKSTILSLVSRYYDVLDGSVLLDGYDVRDLSVSWLRSQIGVVNQEPTLFNATVRENIRYGRDDATDDEVEASAKMANAHNFIVKLPKGYNTQVGERGASLSGGQKQRIAIARALVRNPLILILDEATSALDMTSEAKVRKALEIASEGRTTISVAHRLSTIRNVDVIYVMAAGKVIEMGTHDQLMRNRGHYFDMVITQEPNILTSTKDDGAPAREESESVIEMSPENADTNSLFEEKDGLLKGKKLSFWTLVGLNSPEWKSITVGCISSILMGFSMPLFIIVFGDMFGAMSDLDTNVLMRKGVEIAVHCILIGVVMAISNLAESLSFGIAGAYLTERLRLRMFAHMLQQDISFFDNRANSTGALCARLSAEAAYVQGATGQRIGIVLQGLGSIGLAIVVGMLSEWRVGMIVLAFFPIIATVIYFQSKETSKESSHGIASLENSTKIAMEAVSNIRLVASLGREKRFLSEYMAQLQPTLVHSFRSAHCRGIVAGMSRSMFNFVNSVALTYGGHLIVSQNVSYEKILVLYKTTQSLQMASNQLQNAFNFAPNFQKGINAASRIVAQLQHKPKIFDPVVPAVIGFVPTSKGDAHLKEVKFRYPSRPNVEVFHKLNIKVESGKTVALVGTSGSGKSTVIQLLQRFYDPDSGAVYLDQYPLPNLRLNEVRSVFGLVSQEPILFDRSIMENIAYGVNDRIPKMEEVTDSARKANIHDFIVSLPKGYETNIGSKGVQLSGGQKQRVAIARALIRQPKILLLDEATSALDTESEKVVIQALDEARSGRTCIVIAHRLSTIRDADVIQVIDAGVVVETGTHDQLLNAKGVYANLYHAGR